MPKEKKNQLSNMKKNRLPSVEKNQFPSVEKNQFPSVEKNQFPSVEKKQELYDYFIMSVDADRGISGFGLCKRGEWVQVPVNVYNDIYNAIEDGKLNGTVVGLETKKSLRNWR